MTHELSLLPKLNEAPLCGCSASSQSNMNDSSVLSIHGSRLSKRRASEKGHQGGQTYNVSGSFAMKPYVKPKQDFRPTRQHFSYLVGSEMSNFTKGSSATEVQL